MWTVNSTRATQAADRASQTSVRVNRLDMRSSNWGLWRRLNTDRNAGDGRQDHGLCVRTEKRRNRRNVTTKKPNEAPGFAQDARKPMTMTNTITRQRAFDAIELPARPTDLAGDPRAIGCHPPVVGRKGASAARRRRPGTGLDAAGYGAGVKGGCYPRVTVEACYQLVTGRD